MVDHFQQYHGINNSQIHLFLEVALRVLHQGVIYLILLLRKHHFHLLHLHHALRASILLQPQGQHQLHPQLTAEILSATSAKDMVILLLNVLVEGQ
jgi:hypothetical protein